MVTNNDIPTDFRERAIWVEFQLKLRRKTFASVARGKGWSRGGLRRCLFVPSYPQEVALAKAIGRTPEQLFPERYDSLGNRLHMVRETTSRAAKRKKVAA